MHRTTSGFILVLAFILASPSGAQLTHVNYQTPTGTGSLQKLRGQIDENGLEFLYRIHISDPSAFSATTANSASSGLDTRLYLFTLTGAGLAFNDDDSDEDLNSTLPAGDPLYSHLVPGDYLLGISTFGTVPYGSDDNPVFSDASDSVNGANPYGTATLSYWGEDVIGALGVFEIDLTGSEFVTTIKLDISTTPSSGVAGTSAVNVTGSGFPAGVITPANVTVSFSPSCGSAPVATTTASSVGGIWGSSYRVQFRVPAGLTSGTYYIAINDDVSGDANFVSSTCSQLLISNGALSRVVPKIVVVPVRRALDL